MLGSHQGDGHRHVDLLVNSLSEDLTFKLIEE